MADWFQRTVQNIGPIARYNEEEEQRRIEENKSTLDKVFDTAGEIAGGISNNYNWAKNTLSEYIPEDIQKTIAPFGDTSPISLLFTGLTGANEVEHAMQQTYAPTAAEYNYNAGKGAISGAGGVVGGIADIFGAEGTGNELNAITNLNQRDKEYSGANNILSLDYLTDPSGFTYDLGNMGGSMAALYPSSLLAAPAKVTSAAQTIGRLPFLRGLSQGARETMLRGSLTSIPEGLSEGGNVVRQAKEEGLDNPFLRGWTTAALNVPALALSNGLEYGLLGGKIFRPGARANEGVLERMGRGLYRSVPATAATSAQQGLEEYVQTGISNAQTDKDWGLLPWNASQEQIDALLVGAMTGAPMSGAPSYARSLTTREEERGIPKGVENAEAWKAAEIAANDVGRPDLAKIIYAQWALESARFKETSGKNNYGGLKDTNGNYRDYNSIEDFAHSYANDFLRHYDLSNVETPRDFVHVLKENGYMEADENQYADNVESIANEIQGGISSAQTYNLAVQPGIESQLDGLTPAFRNALPYIGGILNEMGVADGSAISSAYRTPEHNREVGGVEGSYHTKGDAVDIVLPDGITDEQAQAVKKRFEDTGAFEDVLFHDAGSGYHLHLEGYKGGLGRAGNTNTALANVQYDNALMDFADDMINNSDGETSNFFDDKTMTDANGRKIFKATPENVQALEQHYPEAMSRLRNYANDNMNAQQNTPATNNAVRKNAASANTNTEPISIKTPSLDKLREFARRRVKTSRDPVEINNLQALFKNNNEDGSFLDNQKAKDYLMKNYANELQETSNTLQQKAPKPTNNTVNIQNNNNVMTPAQIAEDVRIQEKKNRMAADAVDFVNRFTLPPQAYGYYTTGNKLINQIQRGINEPSYGALNGAQYEQDNYIQDLFTNAVRQQQQADEQARRQAEVEQQYGQVRNNLSTTENPAATGTRATAPVNQQRLQEVSNDVKRYAKARDEFSRQENINKLARNINSLFNGDYAVPSSGVDESRYSLKNLSEAINREKRRNEIYASLTPEEQEFMNWLDVVYEDTGKLFKDVYKEVLDERTQKINDYKEILRSQMKQGVTPRSVAYNKDTGEYKNLPGFSNNYQWYRDMTANGTRRIGKKELEENLEYIAIDHLSNGYVDPQYGVQVPPEAVEDFKQTEDAINGLQEIAGKAKRYEEGRPISEARETGRAKGQRNIQQTSKTTAAIRRDAIHYGRKLHDRLRQAKEDGEIQNPTSVNLEKLEKDINSDSPAKQKKAIEFMENKLDKELPTEEKAAFKEEVIKELAPRNEKDVTPNTETVQDETSTRKEPTEQKPKTKYTLAEGDKSLRKQTKKEALIYSKQGEGFATTSNGSAVRYSPNNNVGVKTSSLPTSVKSNTSSTNSISENETANNENPVKEANEKQRSFVDVKTAEEDLLKAFGLKRANATEEKPKQAKKRIKIVDDSDEALEAEWNKLNKALDNMSSMPFFNPDTVVPLFKIGMIYAQRGINNFANFSERMIAKGGDRIKPWVKPAWNMTASYEGNDLDEKKLAAAFQYVGSKWENGETALGKIKHDFQQLVGKEAAEPYMQYIDTAYKGAQAYFNPDTPVVQLKENTSNEVNENVNGTASSNTQRNSEGDNQNAVGNADESENATGRSGNEDNRQTAQNTAGRSSVRVQSSSSNTGGKTSNSTVRTDKSADKNRSTRNTDLSRSIRDSYEGSTVSDEGRTETVDRPSEERPVNESNLLKRDKALPKERASRLDSIKHDLPKLFPEQQNDVLFAETRLLENKKQGVLFTNGTGTGKTYTGLGVLKRFVNAGKKNILIVTPKNDINKAWIDAAKKDFDLTITLLKDKQDKGNGIVITTYANFGDNDALASRDWDLIIADESHYLMANEAANNTNSLRNLRALTYHQRGLDERVRRVYSKENREIQRLLEKRDVEKELTASEEKKLHELIDFMREKTNELVPRWRNIKEADKPKVVMLSASPFPHTFNIDYAEGYLFNFGMARDVNYDGARTDFYIKHFGYRWLNRKLTRPDANVNTSLMEIQFNQWLKDTGAASGRVLQSDKDYDRGFIRIGSGIGAKVDEGLDYIRKNHDKYNALEPFILRRLKGNGTKYILEAVKAQNSIPLIKQYLKTGKKIVVFHDFRKNTAKNPFAFEIKDFVVTDVDGTTSFLKEAQQQYELLKKERPDLIGLNLNNLKSPIDTLKEAFGDNIGIYNGEVSQRERTKIIKEFNDDNSKLNIILIQRKAGKEGISLHDKTGKHQRVMMDLGLPTTPTDTIQCEGRIYRVGVKSNAILRYLNTGTTMEKIAFATTIAERASTAENLAMGTQARRLKEAYVEAFLESDEGDAWKKYLPGSSTEGTGGKENDRRQNMSMSGFEVAKTFYYGQQKKNARTRAQEGVDYFATPEPLGYKMVEWADIKSGESVLEPSAGHGAIARFFPNNTKNTAIEPSRELAATIRMNMLGSNNRIIEDRFENLSLNNKYDTIVMNPPFGTASKTAMEHLEKAFKHLRNGGRVVALVPAGSSMQKRLEKWLYGDPNAKEKANRTGETKAVLMKKIELPSVTFERAGTRVVTDVYIIDKYDNEGDREVAAAEAQMTTSLRDVDNINDFFDRIQNMSVPERIPVGDSNTQNTQSRPTTGNTRSRTVEPVPATTAVEVTAANDGAIDIDKFNIKEYQHMYHKEADKKTPKTYYAVTNYTGNTFTEVTRNFAQKNNAYIDGITYNFPTKQDRDNFLNDVRAFNANPDEHAVLYPNAPTGFAYDDYRHTQTKDILKRVKVTDRADKEKFSELKSLAKQSGGYYSRFASGFLFNNEADRNKFFDAVRGLNSDDAQYSLNDNLKKELNEYEDIRETAVMLDDSELTDREREFSKIGEMLGTPIYWFKADPGFRGWHSGGITYLNKDGNWPHEKVFWHETFHWIANNNPKLFDDMLNHIMTKSPITQKQLDDYAKKIYRGDKLPKRQLAEEMMADAMYDVVQRTKFLRNLGRENPSLAKRFLVAVRDLLNRFMTFLHNPKGKLTTAQRNAMRDYFHKTALSIKDSNGNNLFERGSDGEIVVNDNRSFVTMSKEEEDMMKEIYGDNYMDELFDDDDDYSARFSADNDKSVDSGTGIFKGAYKNIKKRFVKEKNDKNIKVYDKSARDKKLEVLGNIGGFESILASPSRLAEKYPAFKPVLIYAENAMRRLLKNRNYYNKKLSEAYDYLENKNEDMQELNDLMFKGDATSIEYGKGIENFEERAKAIVEETGVKEGTAKAYIAIRALMDECYTMINRARTQVQVKSEVISKSQLEGLKQNKFVNILDEQQSKEKEDDVLVTYEIRPSRIKKDIFTKQQLEELRKNEAIQILDETEGVKEKDGSEYVYGDDYSTPKGEKINLENNKLYTVRYREAIPKVNKLEGYVPHFFHDFFVAVQNDDGTTTTVDSGRNVKEAYQKAENYLKENKDAKLIIRPKRFDFNEIGVDEDYYSELVGDGAYKKINERISNEFDITLEEAEHLLDKNNKRLPKPKRSSRHRFWGNLQHRTGVKGYESQDLDWVLRHYFNSASRYEALETEFKPKAIGYYERVFGRFDTDNSRLSGTARYIKNYINDVNGNPSAMEKAINDWLNNRRLWRWLFTSRYGDRAALSVASSITNKISILKLGVWNVSSALLNLTQLLNTTALLTRKNPVKAAGEVAKACMDVIALTENQAIRRVQKLKPDERKALEDSGVFDELGLDSGAGYSKVSFGKWANRSMVLFKSAERLARYGTILAAYRQARKELGKNYDEAVEYAQEINRKANFDYGVNDAPNLFRRGSIVSQILFQFMKYPIKQFELMREFTPFNGKKDTTWQQKATFWGGWIWFAGAFGLPAEDLLWSIIGVISEPIFGVSPKQAVRQFLLESSKDATLPERVVIRTLLYGGMSNFGIDISSRVGMADVIPGFGTDYNKDANPIIKAVEKYGGATGGTIAQFYLNAAKGDNLGMLRSVSPGAYNFVTATIGESTDGRGRITTKYDDALSRIIRGMGFKSTTEAVEGEALSLKYYNMDKTAKEKQAAIDDFLDAEEAGKPLGEYARKLKELGVKSSTVKKARENRKKDRMQRGFEKDTPDYAKGAMNLW